MNLYQIIRPLLYQIDAESTHDAVMGSLHRVSRSSALLAATARLERFDDPRLAVELFGHGLPNPLAIAAGLDKNGVAIPALNALGFAFVEVGTVTREPQDGNPRPRVFRLPEDRALINRMGFPSLGVESVAKHLTGLDGKVYFAINVGPNKERVEHAAEDCLAVIERLASSRPLYIVINVSSPNTQRLRTLQGKDALHGLLSDIIQGWPRSAGGIPLLVKIAPDLSDSELDDILAVVIDLALPGIVATNTTIARGHGLRSPAREEQGGLSGEPLRERATEIVARIHRSTASRLTIISAGGVFDGADALDKIGAGATIVQAYTGFVYEGPGMAKRAKRQMAGILDRQGISSLDAIRGTGYRAPRT